VKMVKVKMMVKTILHLHLREHEIPQSLGRGYQVPVWTLLGLLLLLVVVVVVVQTQVQQQQVRSPGGAQGARGTRKQPHAGQR